MKILSTLISLIGAVAICQFIGCSLIGLGVGSLADASTSEPVITWGQDVAKMELGTLIEVTLKSGNKVVGKYAGLAHFSSEEYKEEYSKFREQNKEKIMLPALGENVSVMTELGGPYSVEFLGFDYGIVLLRGIGRTESVRKEISKIRNIQDSKGNIIERETLRELIIAGRFPLLTSGILLKGRNQSIHIPWSQAHQIRLKAEKGALWVLFLIGLAWDISIAIAFSSW